MKCQRPTDRVQSVERALGVLEGVVAAGEIGVSELGQQLGMHVATVHNILRTLTAAHYLRNVNGRYQPGVALAVLLARSSPMTLLARLGEPALDSIVRSTGEAASLTVLAGTVARLVAFQPGTQAITIQHPQWTWEDPLQLSTGRVVVAFADETCRRACVARPEPSGKKRSVGEWEKRFAAIRETGEAETLKSNRDNQYAFASAVRGPAGDVLAAVGASCPAFRAASKHRAAMQTAVRAAARSMATALKYLCSRHSNSAPKSRAGISA